MKTLGIALFTGVLLLTACGSPSASDSIEGTWYASLAASSKSGSESITFSDTLAMTTPTTVNGVTVNLAASNLSINDSGGCYDSISAQIGSFVTSGTSNSFTFGVQSSNAMLVMQGTMKNGQLTGTWTSGGSTSACSGSGNFTMTKGPGSGFPKRGS